MNAWWIKVAADLDAHPKAFAAGWDGVACFDRLLRLNGQLGADGVIPAQYANPAYLAQRWGVSLERVSIGLQAVCNAELVSSQSDGSVRINGWDDTWRPRESSTRRVIKHRAKLSIIETQRNAMKQNETLKPLDQTRLDQKRVDKSTDQKLLPSPPGVCAYDLEAVYALYPRHEGKKKGMAKLKTTIRTQERYDQLLRSVQNYRRKVELERTEKQFIKQFSTFANCWEDYVDWVEGDAVVSVRKGRVEPQPHTAFVTGVHRL